jgi:hypothetical protein
MTALHNIHSFASWRWPDLAACTCVIILAAPPGAAYAQQTREEAHGREQAAKAAAVAPSTKNVAERVVDRLRDFGLFDDDPVGLYPFITKVYPSGGVALGGGYRKPFLDTGALNATAALSFRNFKSAGVELQLPRLAAGKLAIDAGLSWIDAPAVPFYGVGDASSRAAATEYGYRPTTVGVTMRYAPRRALTFGGGVDYLQISATATAVTDAVAVAGPRPPAFDATSGLDADPRYARTHGVVEIDWRSDPGFTGRGGLYRMEAAQYSELGDAPLGFRRFDAEAVQLVPLLRANWVLALRGLATITQTSEGDAVPFYLMPTLGGNSDLRGFSTMRFRGAQRVLVSAELRWTPARMLDMALFYDAGKVADRARELSLTHLRESYGIGARFHTQGGTMLRWELAHSREHALRFIWSFGAAF